jgi:hypothetical protein
VSVRSRIGIRSVLASRPVLTLLVVATLWLGGDACGTLTAPSRLSPDVRAALLAGRVQDVAVTLPFRPEQFHIRLFQEHGTVSGVSGNTVLVRRVAPESLREIAKNYWVQSIDALR